MENHNPANSENEHERKTPGDRLKEVIAVTGATQQKLADELGVSRVTINALVAGRNEISKTMALAIKSAWGINERWLLYGEAHMWADGSSALMYEHRFLHIQQDLATLERLNHKIHGILKSDIVIIPGVDEVVEGTPIIAQVNIKRYSLLSRDLAQPSDNLISVLIKDDAMLAAGIPKNSLAFIATANSRTKIVAGKIVALVQNRNIVLRKFMGEGINPRFQHDNSNIEVESTQGIEEQTILGELRFVLQFYS